MTAIQQMKIGRRSGLVVVAFIAAVTCGLALALPVAGAADLEQRQAQPGQRLTVDEVVLVVPTRGHGVWGAGLQADGDIRAAGVETLPDGRVVVHRFVTPPTAVSHGLRAPAPCSDGAYSLYSTKWTTTYAWYFKASTTPPGMTQDAAKNAFTGAASNITSGRNDCGLADHISAKHKYSGTTSTGTNIGNGSTCLTGDGKSVVLFGDLAAGDLGFACWWTSGGSTKEADLKLNKFEYNWVIDLGGCTNRYSVEAVATHEFGHAFGLGHVDESQHGNLTMSPVIKACQSSEVTLGLGDIKGLEAKY